MHQSLVFDVVLHITGWLHATLVHVLAEEG
jgi:hypothetical protein